MKPWAASLQSLLLALWTGSLWTVGWVPVVLFGQLPQVLAGDIAARIFTIGAWIGIVCGVLLIALRLRFVPKREAQRRDWMLWGLVVMLLLALAGHFGIGAVMDNLRAQAAPLAIRDSPLRAQFGMWHGVSSTLYLIEGVIGLGLVALLPRSS